MSALIKWQNLRSATFSNWSSKNLFLKSDMVMDELLDKWLGCKQDAATTVLHIWGCNMCKSSPWHVSGHSKNRHTDIDKVFLLSATCNVVILDRDGHKTGHRKYNNPVQNLPTLWHMHHFYSLKIFFVESMTAVKGGISEFNITKHMRQAFLNYEFIFTQQIMRKSYAYC